MDVSKLKYKIWFFDRHMKFKPEYFGFKKDEDIYIQDYDVKEFSVLSIYKMKFIHDSLLDKWTLIKIVDLSLDEYEQHKKEELLYSGYIPHKRFAKRLFINLRIIEKLDY
jgi:hypothetical protein